MTAGSGCAAQSCPEPYFEPGVQLDAGAWVGSSPGTLHATVCVAGVCDKAVGTPPSELFASAELPATPVTVRIELTTSTGRTLDVSTKAQAQTIKPFGSGCGGLVAIALVVDKSGALTITKPTVPKT